MMMKTKTGVCFAIGCVEWVEEECEEEAHPYAEPSVAEVEDVAVCCCSL